MSDQDQPGTAKAVSPAATLGPPDPNAPGTTDWMGMTAAARATACMLMLEQRWPLVVDGVRWNRRAAIVFVSRTVNQGYAPSSKRIVMASDMPSLVAALSAIKARHGLRVAAEVDKLVGKRR